VGPLTDEVWVVTLPLPPGRPLRNVARQRPQFLRPVCRHRLVAQITLPVCRGQLAGCCKRVPGKA